jgi:hypothetical protein
MESFHIKAGTTIRSIELLTTEPALASPKRGARACELTQWKEARRLVTLAAAQAKAGDFEAAVKWQETAFELLDGSDSARREHLKTLARYKAKKPFYRLGLLEEWGFKSISRLRRKLIGWAPAAPDTLQSNKAEGESE